MRLITVLIIIFVYLQYHLWFQGGGIRELVQLHHKINDQEVFINSLKEQNNVLSFQVKRLKESQEEAESRARDELGMIKKEETFYRIIKK